MLRRWRQQGWTMAAVLAGTLGASLPAQATVQNQMTYKKAYPDAKSVSCKTCHEGAMGKSGDLNAYGQALEQFKGKGQAGKLTAEDLKAFDAADNDKDGVANRAELDAGTNPNDPASK